MGLRVRLQRQQRRLHGLGCPFKCKLRHAVHRRCCQERVLVPRHRRRRRSCCRPSACIYPPMRAGAALPGTSPPPRRPAMPRQTRRSAVATACGRRAPCRTGRPIGEFARGAYIDRGRRLIRLRTWRRGHARAALHVLATALPLLLLLAGVHCGGTKGRRGAVARAQRCRPAP